MMERQAPGLGESEIPKRGAVDYGFGEIVPMKEL
jgi:hypothetical protein